MVRVRFAPSPTGYLHVGNMRTALTNYLFARKEGGIFVLRIEDTDVERSDASYEASILEDLNWLGISWDEGPFRQSERTDIYRRHVESLLERGMAYKCFCSKERLEEMRKASIESGKPPRYDGSCRGLTGDDLHGLEKEGRPFVIRFKAPQRAVRIKDLIHGDIFFPSDHVDDFILMKQEMTPSYNFAVTVDDMLMEISHVIRGADHVSNTPKQVMLFEAFKKAPPRYAHHSLLTGQDQKPLSKRHGATHVREFRDMGVLKQALVNYVAIIGRNLKKELMDHDELIRSFTIESLSPSDSLFDMEKLLWLNKEYIRKSSPESILLELNLPPEYREKVALLQENSRTLAEVRSYLGIFDGVEIGDEGLAYLAGMKDLKNLVALIGGLLTDGGETIGEIVKKMEAETGLPKKELFMLLRIFFTGRKDGPSLKDLFPLIPKENMKRRISWAEEKLSLA